MTRLPSPVSLQALLDPLRALNQKPRNRSYPDPTMLANLERRTIRAHTRDSTGTTDRDGYPSSTLSGGYTNGNGSTTENHALSAPERDRHHELTTHAIDSLGDAVGAIQAWISALDAIDALTSDLGPTPRVCTACAGYRPQGGDQPVAHRSTVGNRLERDADLCAACYAYVCQSAPANSRQGRLPTPHDVNWHDLHGRWRLRITT